MKKIYIVASVFVTVILASCTQEKSFDELSPVGENGIAFSIAGDASTRSMETASEAEPGISIPLGHDDKGNAFYLEETIENLNPSPATKGAPAYTANLGDVFKTMGVYAEGKFGDQSFVLMDQSKHMGEPSDPNAPDGKGWRYHHNYDGSPWPDNTNKVDFFLRMPADAMGVSELTYSNEAKSIAFDLGSPLTGKEQQDILFAQTSLSKEEHDGYLPNGAPVLMYHALSGVKFRTGNDNTGSTKTIITKVKLTGLKGSGHCVVTPSSGSVVWTDLGTDNVTFSQGFDNPDYTASAGAANADGTVQEWNANLNGTSWTAAAADQNLNHANGELTFWFIPQEITDKVKLKVTFCVKTPDTAGETGGGEITHEIEFGKILVESGKNHTWDAGQLRTYTLVPTDVDVAIFDQMEGLAKSGLHISNTGNVDEYVRIVIVGNWYGWLPGQDPAKDEPGILVGYKTDGSAGEDDNEMVDYWDYRDTSKEWGSYFDNSFKYGVVSAAGSKWKRGDGAYYYTEPIGAGVELTSGTDVLFQSYELPSGKVPDIYIPSITSNVRDKAIGVHLVMEVVVQAIPTTSADGNEYADCWAAWSDVTGTTIGPKN